MAGSKYALLWGVFAFALFAGCGANQGPLARPDVALEPTSAAATSSVSPSTIASAESPEPTWPHVQTVASWPEVFRGKTNGHAFAGASTATVSTRISEPALAAVLNGSASWRDMQLGASVSQLVFSPGNTTSWSVAYVAERIDVEEPNNSALTETVSSANTRSTSTPNDAASLVAFYLVSPSGVIDASQQQLCASCHAQRGP